AVNNGACPELMSNSSRGASVFVETVKLICLRAKARRPAQPSTARASTRRANLFLPPSNYEDVFVLALFQIRAILPS
ncbi:MULTISPECIES: hypothetical protein, partial [unclassified Brevundimonas]|uniref:hypothetical protein n=1 Tax=unclassified Brevundimonas TaxID=2622653 RepID=UPI003F9260D3